MDPNELKYNFRWTQSFKDSLTKRLNDAVCGLSTTVYPEPEVTDDSLAEANAVLNRIKAMK